MGNLPFQHPFDLLVQGCEAEIRAAEAALLFAADYYPALKAAPYLERLARLARRLNHYSRICDA